MSVAISKGFAVFILSVSIVSAGDFSPEFFANIDYSSSKEVSAYVSPRSSMIGTSELILLAVFFLSYSIRKEHF